MLWAGRWIFKWAETFSSLTCLFLSFGGLTVWEAPATCPWWGEDRVPKADPLQGTTWDPAVLPSPPKQDSSNDLFWHRGNGKHNGLPVPFGHWYTGLVPTQTGCTIQSRGWCAHTQGLQSAGVGSFISCLTLQLSQGFKEHFHYSVAVVRHFHGLTASMPNHCLSHRWISLSHSVSTFHFPEIQSCSLSKERTTIRK